MWSNIKVVYALGIVRAGRAMLASFYGGLVGSVFCPSVGVNAMQRKISLGSGFPSAMRGDIKKLHRQPRKQQK